MRVFLFSRPKILIMKPCYGELVQPPLAVDVGMTGASLVKMAGQGAVCIRAIRTLCL